MSRGRKATPRLHLRSMVSDVLKNLWVILLAAAAVTMLMDLYTTQFTPKRYRTKATFVVTSKNNSSYSYINLSAAQSMATTLQSILNSDILKNEVRKDLGLAEFDASVTASVIKETNLLELYVTSSSPERSFRIIRSIMQNYQNLTQYVSQEAFMQVLEEPSVPTRSYTGQRNVPLLGRTFLLSAGVLVMLFLWLSYNNDTVKSEDDLVEKIDAKALGIIAHEKGRLFRRRIPPLVSDVNVSFGFTEEHRKIAARLVTTAAEMNAKVILFTSLRPHEGKSNVAANQALTLAEQNYKVIVLDCDFRRPLMYRLFGFDQFPEFADMLRNHQNPEKAIVSMKGIDFLLNSHTHADSTELLADSSFKNLLPALKEKYDFVIVDTPPMAGMSDAEVVASAADMSVMVIQYNRELAGYINDAVDQLGRTRAPAGGAVLNDVRGSRNMGNSRYGYGGYSRYGKYGRYGRYGHYAERKKTEEV